jgi:sugar phosphate isomerase/epimerase
VEIRGVDRGDPGFVRETAGITLNRFGYGAALQETSVRDSIDFAASLGLGAVELSLNLPVFFPEAHSASLRSFMRQYALDRGVTLTVHAPEDLSLLSLQRCIRTVSVDRLREAVDFAADVGARRVTMHVGSSVFFTMPDGTKHSLLDDYADDCRAAMETCLRQVRDHAAGGPLVCVENDPQFHHALVREVLSSLLREGNLYLTWDLGHSFGRPAQHDFMLEHAALVRDCHVHDHDGRSNHLVPGTGKSDLAGYLRLLSGNDTHFIFEVRPRTAVPACVRWAKGMLQGTTESDTRQGSPT